MRGILSLFYANTFLYANKQTKLCEYYFKKHFYPNCLDGPSSVFNQLSFVKAFFAFSLFALLNISTSYGQLDSCNIFLKGNYIEVGINVNGAYGSSVDAPSGYHPKGPATEYNTCYNTCTNNGNLGFVADPDKDGWTTGTPTYFGDYFLPGFPQEGWSIMVNGNQANAWNGGGKCTSITSYPFSTTALTGSNITYVSSGSKRSGIWQGNYDSLTITQTTSLDTSTVFFTTYVKIVNKGKITRNDIYYLRTVDPDNAEPENGVGGFTTLNNIDYQLPNTLGATLVSATDTTYSRCYLGLGTLDCRAKCFIDRYSVGLAPTYGMLDSMYSKFGGKGDTVHYIYSGSYTDDVGISLIFKLGNLAAGDSLNLAYTYILKQSDLTAALATTSPQWETDTITKHKSGDTATVCGSRIVPITIINGGTSSWTWYSLSGDTILPSSGINVIVHRGSSPVSYIKAVGTSLCSFDTMIIKLSSSPRITVDSVPSICSGSTVRLRAHGGLTYTWTPTTGLSCSTCDSPLASPTSTTTYKVVGTSSGGCSDSATVTVNVGSGLTVSAGADKAICRGSSTTLTATGATSYSWSPTTGLSCSSCSNPTASPTTTTSYVVTGSNGSGCSNKDTVIVNVNALPIINAGADKTICLGSSTTLTATGGTTYSWFPTTGLSCSTCVSPTASPLTTTTYVVTGTDANGCINIDTVIVNVNPLPTVSAGTDKAICNGSSASLTATGASSYSWSPTTGLSCSTCASPTASPTTTTTYVVTGTGANGCTNTDTVIVTVNPLPTVNAGPDKIICNGGSVSLVATASGAVSYSWSPTTGLSCSSCLNPVASPTSTTTYYLTATSANSCQSSDTVIVKVNPLPTVSAGADKNVCLGNTTTLTAGGASVYSWTPSTGLSCTTCTSPTVSVTTTTTYIVTGTDTNGCVKNDTVVVNVHSLPTVNAGSDKSICIGTSTTLTATGASTYSWTPSTGLSCTGCAGPTASPTTTTNYVVTGTDTNGCQKTDTVQVKVNGLPAVTGTGGTICLGDSVTLSAGGATTYTWSPSTGLSCSTCLNPKASPTTTTSYYIITGVDSNGCSNTDTIRVIVNPLPNVSAGVDKQLCVGNTTSLTATGASTYSWTPSAGLSCTTCASPIVSAIATTTYIVTGTDTNSCVKKDTVVVTVNPLPAVSAGVDKTICNGSSVSLAATGASTYSWSPGTGLSCSSCSSPVASPTTTKTYVVTGTDSNSCQKTDTVIVRVNPLPTISAGADKSMCVGSTVTLNGSSPSTYSWTPSTGLSCTNCASPISSVSATTIYILTGTDTNGCNNTDTVVVKVNSLPVVSAGTDKTICVGNSATLNATGATTYTWTPATGLSCSSCSSPIVSTDSSTTYRVVGVDTNGCRDSDAVVVRVNPLPNVTAGPGQTVCKGISVNLIALGALTYNWTPASGLSCSTCSSLTATPLVTTSYLVTGTDSNGCKDTSMVLVKINPLPIIKVNNDTTLCQGASLNLFATGAASYLWTPATGLSCTTCANPVASPTKNITYAVIGTDSLGCIDSNKVTITFIDKNVVNVSLGDTLCKGESAHLLAQGGTSYLWIPSNGLSGNTIPDPTATPDSTTNYMVIIKQGTCFTDTEQVLVVVNPVPTVTVNGERNLFIGEKSHLFAVGDNIYSYHWSSGKDLSCIDCASPIASPSKTVTYIVLVTSEEGCKAHADITITVKCDNSHVFLPNTFSPNGDGLNDRFYPSGSGISLIKSFMIFNRWGEKLYEADDIPLDAPKYGWDGTYKGEALKPDVFVYIINAVCEEGEPIQIKGDISLVR